MVNWYLYALAALLLIGLQRFLYKVAAVKDCNTALTTFSFMGTVAILSSISVFISFGKVSLSVFLIIVSLLNSLSFVTSTMSNIQALKYISAAIAYPIIRLNIVIVVLFSIVVFGDNLSFYQWLGVLFSITAMLVLAKEYNKNSSKKIKSAKGIWLVFLAMIAGSVATISSKFAAIYTNKMAFIAVSYILSTLFAFSLYSKIFPSEQSKQNKSFSLGIGIVMGIINIIGFYAYLQALSTGPLSIVASINGMHFVVAVVLSVVIYKERLNFSIILGLLLTGIALVLLKGNT